MQTHTRALKKTIQDVFSNCAPLSGTYSTSSPVVKNLSLEQKLFTETRNLSLTSSANCSVHRVTLILLREQLFQKHLSFLDKLSNNTHTFLDKFSFRKRFHRLRN